MLFYPLQYWDDVKTRLFVEYVNIGYCGIYTPTCHVKYEQNLQINPQFNAHGIFRIQYKFPEVRQEIGESDFKKLSQVANFIVEDYSILVLFLL